MLMDHADSGGERGAGTAGRQRLGRAVGCRNQDAALIGRVVAEEDVHQRRLAGAVLAEQRQDLARVQVERDRVVRDERAEALRHVGDAEDEGGGGGHDVRHRTGFADERPNPLPQGRGFFKKGGSLPVSSISAPRR